MRTLVIDTVMGDHPGRARLAQDVLEFAGVAADPMAGVAAIIPVGTLEGAKTRLADTLDAEERHDLVEDLLARTVASALAVARLDDVLVISPDPEVLTRAAEIGARTLRQRTSGLNAGLARHGPM